MCGIVSQFHFDGVVPDPGMIRKMAKSIYHRGPDDEGYFENEWFSLGFRRLSVLDLSNFGHQPMLSKDKRYVLVFNGEVYNFKSL